MSEPIVLALPGNDAMAARVAEKLAYRSGRIECHHFPDGETHLRYLDAVAGRKVVLVCTLDRPDDKFLPLVFAADAARELGASAVGLVAPYLAYMRQDRRFETGEAVTSHSFARLISERFDWLVTMDPHLHRYRSLAEIYSIPATVLHAAPLLAQWIARNVPNPILVGPDAESAQWVSKAAAEIGAPFTVLEKTRKGDRDVEVRVPDRNAFASHTPVLLDDIVSSGETMLKASESVRAVAPVPPVAVAVHAVFADGVAEQFARARLSVTTTNTIAHASNAIDVSGMIATAVAADLAR